MAQGKSGTVGIIKRIGQCFLWAALILTVVLAAYIMICSAQGRAASVFGRSIVRVVSGSMEPTIHEGDYIILRSVDSAELEKGDVICYYFQSGEMKGMLNTHRIAGRLDDGGFITKGDANNVNDPYAVYPDAIVGKYLGKVRILRWLNSFASVKKLLLAAVIAIMSATAVYEVVTIAKLTAKCREKSRSDELAVREAIDREKQKLYERDRKKESEDK